ncbi:hypothetical protein BHM03_00054035 [Ensete ventricosum]|nr:hypothetical protein BHM03_00054035 [Ensete ventricosum]
MGEGSATAAEDGSSSPSSVSIPPRPPPKKLTVLPLIALIFYNVSGGPFGVEDSVSAGGGPLLSLLGFLVFPLLWSLPEALVTAELASSFPENGGYVLWISSAFGSFWGFQEGFWKWVSGTMDNALYPVLFLDYIRQSLPIFDHPAVRTLALLALTAALTFLNYRGLNIVGLSAVALTAFSLSPFVVMALLAIPRIRPRRWLAVNLQRANFRGYFNSMFWNLNYWDKASTLAGEVEDPSRSFPRAIFGAVVLVMASYLIPLLAGTGALDVSTSEEWTDGYFAQVGMVIGGAWLRWWIQAAAAMSNMGLFEAEMSSDSFQLLGMSELGMLPAIFGKSGYLHTSHFFACPCHVFGFDEDIYRKRGGRVNKIALNRWFLVAIISVYLLEKPMGSRPLLSVGDVQNAVPEGKIEIRKGDSRNTISRIRIHADVVVLGPKSAAITNPSPFRG